ncbi:ribonucleotide-diphosphate reductase subunit beta [Lactobacillus sp. PV034]|uniref:ribonucleotide-diphosphate reductase subunit beta n=1 Tax=Lactobacillus sp. PV034 TaxID=2594495 RepID=UPI00223F157C|nr:ribonucleotide-diphosphate reductase subunit beta [Lactobacillus sp. PV034]QNQ81282.1 ribonucleotide-diphosphate reductase subunit beta [Lactobacillus sp. PV034]
MTNTNFKPFDWKSGKQNVVDNSAWSRLNDIIYESRRVPIKKDIKEFLKLPVAQQEVLLHSFASLSLTSALQMKKGVRAVQEIATSPKEIAVFNALQYLESLNNRAYSYIIEELTRDSRTDRSKIFDWAINNQHLQEKNYQLNSIYESGNPLQRLAVLVLVNSGLYHSAFFAPLYLFGQGHLSRTAELTKDALRVTSFSGMYPGIKFRDRFNKLSSNKQEEIKIWVDNLIDTAMANESKHIELLYQDTDWTDNALNYVKYSINKGLMSLGLETKYPQTIDDIDSTIKQGLVENADGDDFFFYANKHAITHMNEI